MLEPFEILWISVKIAVSPYLITPGGHSLFNCNKLIVSGDAATAANVLAHEPLFQLAFAADLIATASYAVVTLVLYKMFKTGQR